MERETIRTLLVDDEAVVRQSIRDLLAQYPDFTVVGEANSKAAALELLGDQAVDAIFMDIQMPGGSGFQLAEAVHAAWPETLCVFLTGHANFALDGYDYSPVDFLVKPVDPKRFAKTVERITKRVSRRRGAEPQGQLSLLMEGGGCRIVTVEEVAYVERVGRKVWAVCRDGTRIAAGQSIQDLDDLFAPFGFFRCHQSYLVPKKDICSIRRDPFGQSFWLELIDGRELSLSRRKYYELREILEQQGIVLG